VTAEENIVNQVCALLELGSVPKSHCSGGFLRTIRPLLDASVIVEERSGAGRCLVLRDAVALFEFSRQQFPNVPISQELGNRVNGIARFRDSKALPSDTHEIVCLRAWREGVLTVGGQPADVASATAQYGVFSFLLDATRNDYSLRGGCALAENPVIFTRFEHLRMQIGAVLYGHGRISNRALEWLANNSDQGFELVHLPDYDPAGLNEFERLRVRLGGRVRLHLPADLDERFARFSNRALLQAPNSRAMLLSLRRSGSTEIQQVLRLIEQHNAGLEQEALLV
jgi:hypothetical protein